DQRAPRAGRPRSLAHPHTASSRNIRQALPRRRLLALLGLRVIAVQVHVSQLVQGHRDGVHLIRHPIQRLHCLLLCLAHGAILRIDRSSTSIVHTYCGPLDPTVVTSIAFAHTEKSLPSSVSAALNSAAAFLILSSLI